MGFNSGNLFHVNRLNDASGVDLIRKLFEIAIDVADSSPWSPRSECQRFARSNEIGRLELIHIFCASFPFLTEERFPFLLAHRCAGCEDHRDAQCPPLLMDANGRPIRLHRLISSMRCMGFNAFRRIDSSISIAGVRVSRQAFSFSSVLRRM